MHLFHEIMLRVLDFIARLGYAGLFAGMTLQATGFVPLPSEVMMSFGGYLANLRTLALGWVIAAGTAGDLAGAIIAYVVGFYGGRPLLERFGRFVFVRHQELERAERWFARFGSRAVLICKMLPGIRSFAALPAGISRMNLGHFVGYTAIGATLWCTAFSLLGFTLGRDWVTLEPIFRRFSLLLIAVLVAAIAFWIWSHFRAEKQAAKA
ncbi:MAG TPA: DedA family protein [Candidatus Eremiobacteraceae bacterium]|nr:DedA family protein [Candidatus Eremiobacteraceae bacterium]